MRFCWLGFRLVGAVAYLSTPCRGTHQRLTQAVHLIWLTYVALAPTLDRYLH